MKQILFVDDEAMVLNGLRRMLTPLKAEWDMHFVQSAGEALELMAEITVDVVVTDWRMPNMDGLRLLEEVADKYGGTVRFILSGQLLGDDQGDCLVQAHQVLDKPCDFTTLERVLQSITKADTLLGSGLVKQESTRLHTLPPLPSIYQEVAREMDKPAPSMGRITAIIHNDPAISSRLLGIVNSAAYGLRGTVSSTGHAIALLGLNTVRSIIVAMHCLSMYEAEHKPLFSRDQLWAHCTRTAGLIKHFGAQSESDRNQWEAAFIAGMLHDMGKIALAALFPEEYAQTVRKVQKESRHVYEAECEVFGATHADVGAYILSLWGMPEAIVDLVASHHAPDRITTVEGAMLFTANAMDHRHYILHPKYIVRDEPEELARHPLFTEHSAAWTALSDTYYAEMTPDEK